MALTNSAVETYVLCGNASRRHFFPDVFILVNLHFFEKKMVARHVQTMELITGDKGNPRTPSIDLGGVQAHWSGKLTIILAQSAVFAQSFPILHSTYLQSYCFSCLDPQSVLRDREGGRRDALRKPSQAFY